MHAPRFALLELSLTRHLLGMPPLLPAQRHSPLTLHIAHSPQVLHADLYVALPLALPPALRLKELDVSATRLLVDWGQLCSQVGRLRWGGGWEGDLHVARCCRRTAAIAAADC